MAQSPLPGLRLLLPHSELSRVPSTQSQGHSSCQLLESVGKLTPQEQGDRHNLQPQMPEHTFGIASCVYGYTTLNTLDLTRIGSCDKLGRLINPNQSASSLS